MKYDNGKILELFNQELPRDEINKQVFRKTYPLVTRMTRKYRRFASYQDITQEGYKALFDAIKSFNQEACPNFYGWAFLHVKKVVNRTAYSFKQYSERYQLTANAVKLLENELDATTPEDVLFNIELTKVLEKASRGLGKETGYIIRKLFGIGDADQKTILELQDSTQLSRHRIRKIRDMGIQQLRRDQHLLEALR